MSPSDWIRAGALYFPLVLALLAGLTLGRRPRVFAACLLSVLWSCCTLLLLQRVNLWTRWWTFSGEGATLLRMPLELYFGWIIIWGILPQLLFRRLPIALSGAVMIAVDAFAMPICSPVVLLGSRWLLGEAIAASTVLVPALLIARWTREDTHLRARAAMQVAIAAMLFLYLLPEVTFALRPGEGWTPLLQMSSWTRQLALQFLFILALPGVTAVAEFAERGRGTPIPYDPPKRLVTSGIYRYCANPMQTSCALVMALWACLLRNGWLFFAAAISFAYCAGIAEWDEHQDLERRFGAEWKQYRTEVRNWFPRWRPYDNGRSARLYVAATCGPCSEVRRWFAARKPVGLEIIDAETLPYGSITRMRYDPNDGTAPVDGIRAMGRALEHLSLAWALAGAAIRLPVLWQLIQLVMDASGFGPRTPGLTSSRPHAINPGQSPR
jgi:protein-S-isoprenylcysteine O-methyltransferase Ste14